MNRCTFHLHAWPKWSAPEEVVVTLRKTFHGIPVTDWEKKHFRLQTRTCESCGLYQERYLDAVGREVRRHTE